MSNVQIPAYCLTCQRQTLHIKPRINHTAHLIGTIVTVGMWSVVWLAVGLANSAELVACSQCGSRPTAKQILNDTGVDRLLDRAGIDMTPNPKRALYEPRLLHDTRDVDGGGRLSGRPTTP